MHRQTWTAVLLPAYHCVYVRLVALTSDVNGHFLSVVSGAVDMRVRTVGAYAANNLRVYEVLPSLEAVTVTTISAGPASNKYLVYHVHSCTGFG
jgi:hypothetical protein